MLAVSPTATLDAMGESLARARLTGALVEVDLPALADRAQAEDLRDAALRSLG